MSKKLLNSSVVWNGHRAFQSKLTNWSTASKAKDEQFFAANFLLENRVSSSRVNSYVENVETAEVKEVSDWKEAHENYLDKFVRLNPSTFPKFYILGDSLNCPQSFQFNECFVDAVRFTDAKLLFRIDKAKYLLEAAKPESLSMDDLYSLIRKVQAGKKSVGHDQALCDLNRYIKRYKAKYLEKQKLAPLFATFWEEIKPLLTDASGNFKDDWANVARDALGLTSFSGKNDEPLSVLAWLCPVDSVPKLDKADGMPALVAPTPVDFSFYDAFCPYPEKNQPGRCVYLGDKPPPSRLPEVLHGFPHDLLPEHLVAYGEIITKPSPLPVCRECHLNWLAEKCETPKLSSD